MLVPQLEMQPIVRRIWEDKYRYVKADGSSDENDREASIRRVCDGIYKNDSDDQAKQRAIRSMLAGIWCPGGRISENAFSSLSRQCMAASMALPADNLAISYIPLNTGVSKSKKLSLFTLSKRPDEWASKISSSEQRQGS